MTETKKFNLPISVADTFEDIEKSFEDEIGKKKRGQRGGSTKVMLMKDINIEYPGFTAPPAAEDGFALQITTNKETALVKISDKDCIFKWYLRSTGISLEPQDLIVKKLIDRLYLKKEVHFGVDSFGYGATLDYDIEIGFNYKYISDWQFARMLARLS